MIKLTLIVLCIFISFLYGMSVIQYEIFPYENLKNLMILFNNSHDDKNFEPTVYENEIRSLISINSKQDIFEKRLNMIEYIWNESEFPSNGNISLIKNFSDERYEDLDNLDSMDKITVSMQYDVNSIAYLFHSKISTGNLIIYHEGHNGDFINGKYSIQFFLNEGYDVLAFSMPLLGMNNQPIVDTSFGKIKLSTHNHLKFLDNQKFSSLVFFFEPIFTSIDFLENEFNYDSYNMLGISGGGWTTTVYSSIDDRISNSFSISDSFPIYLRSDAKNLGDYEQTRPDFYSISNYLEIYILSSYDENRIHIQFLNKYDPCCFSGESNILYKDIVEEFVAKLDGGKFDIIIDDTHKEHKISDFVLSKIIQELRNT